MELHVSKRATIVNTISKQMQVLNCDDLLGIKSTFYNNAVHISHG